MSRLTRRTEGSRWLIAALGCLSALGPLSLDLALPALPALKSELGTTDTLAQVTISACLIGLAIGQFVAGPISDRIGRRPPLLIGLIAYCVLSAACAFAPSIVILLALRLLVGVAGGTGIVISRAVVRDVYRGRDVSRIFSLLSMITATAPIVAPLLGGALLKLVDWRMLFVVMASFGVVILVIAALVIPETPATLPADHASRAGSAPDRRSGLRVVLTDPLFVASTIVLTLVGAGVFAYISDSTFVFQNQFGFSPQQFSFVFGANAAGVVVSGYVNARLVRRFGPRPLLIWGNIVATAGAAACLAGALVGDGVVPVIIVSLFFTLTGSALVSPNATALGMLRHRRHAGTASGVLGTGPFLVGAAVAPLASLAGVSATSMATVLVAMIATSCAVVLLVIRPMRIEEELDDEPMVAAVEAEGRGTLRE